jgi:myo-inositol catabolism protein IolS
MVLLALAWLLHQSPVASVIAGARNAAQAEQNAQAAELELTDATLRELADATEAVKQALGPNLDLWQSESRIR